MGIGKLWQFIRNFLFSRINRELLIFLFFLALSGIFWLSLTLNETYEREFTVPVSVMGVPKNAVLTSDEVDTIRVTINEFVDIAKLYSTEKSGGYINGMLDGIARHLIATGKLAKFIEDKPVKPKVPKTPPVKAVKAVKASGRKRIKKDEE